MYTLAVTLILFHCSIALYVAQYNPVSSPPVDCRVVVDLVVHYF